MSIMLILSCYTGFFNVRRGWQSLNTGPRFYLRLIRRTSWLWIYTSRTTDGRPFKPKKLSVPFVYPGVPAGLTPFRGLVPLGRRNLVHNGQQKKNKKTNDDLQDITPKTKDSATWTPHINQGWFWEIGKDSTGFDINGCSIAQCKWKRHPTCPIGQVRMILRYVQFLKSKMINIELFSVGSHGEFYLNIASYVSCILRHFVLFCWLRNSPFSNKDRVIYISQSRMPN